MLQTLFNLCLQGLQGTIGFLSRYQLPLLCVLGGAGVGIYSYGVRKFSRLRRKQREEAYLHPEAPVPALPEAGNGESVIDFLQNASGKKAPVITISLGSYKGSFNYGSGDIVIDFAWYEPYKPMVDNIIAGIIWAVWLWHMYKRIPDIIAGNSMTTASVLRATRKDD